jgi:stage III sporulation protein AD
MLLMIIIKIREITPVFATLTSIGACVLIMYFTLDKLRQFVEYVERIVGYVSVNIAYIDVILKMIGISYICQFSTDVCKDAGNSALATQIETVTKLTLVLLGMPVLISVVELVVNIVEG